MFSIYSLAFAKIPTEPRPDIRDEVNQVGVVFDALTPIDARLFLKELLEAGRSDARILACVVGATIGDPNNSFGALDGLACRRLKPGTKLVLTCLGKNIARLLDLLGPEQFISRKFIELVVLFAHATSIGVIRDAGSRLAVGRRRPI